MRFLLAVGLVMLGAGCAHSPEKVQERSPGQTSSAQELSLQAEASYEALDFPACAAQFRQLAELQTEDFSRAESFYSAAGCAAMAGDQAQSLELLKLSLQNGYFDADHLQHNPELASLHAHPGWQEVLAGTKANLAKAPHPPMAVGILSAIDVYGSRRVDAETVQRLLGVELGKPTVPSKALFTQKEEELRRQYNLAFAKVTFIYFGGGEEKGRAFLTVDLVDAEDAHRLRFLPKPSGQPEDPEGLVAQWMAYEAKTYELMQKGELDLEKSTCRVAHCTFGFGHPELAPYEPVFIAKVPMHQDTLAKVLREDTNEEKRAAAAYLLAYTATPEQTVERLVPSIRDPSGGVRNNVLRVLTATQEAAAQPLVDVAMVVDALSLPETMDRNKALYLLEMLLKDLKPEALKAQQAPLIRQIGSQLVALTALQQPINREPAINVLKLLSGEEHQTPEQWKAWLARQKL